MAMTMLVPIFLVACQMNTTADNGLPYMQTLAPFNPHVASFECQIEASKLPPLDAQANDWFLQARALEDPSAYMEDPDYKQIVRLTRQAAERHHWKAMLNLASLYVEGRDRPNGANEALLLVSQAMELGIPAAYDRMGTYFLNGTGVHANATRAYEFFQKAAELGNPQAMAFLGEKMDAGADGIKPGYWGNIPVAIKMFECALAQGYGRAAEELKYMYEYPRRADGSELNDATPESLNKVMRAMHEGVKGGSEQCAVNLFIEFDHPMHAPENVFVPFLDKARGERYSVLANALGFNPDRRFPNLDKILPLPPALLPPWDGKRDSLLKAAMAVTPKPSVAKATEASRRQGRFFLEASYAFLPAREITEASKSPVSGYWQPTSPEASAEVRTFLSTISPGLYQTGEAFEQPRVPSGLLTGASPKITWQRVLTVHNNDGAVEPRAAAGLAREVDRPQPHVQCGAHAACPIGGTWQPWLPPGHPLEQAVNQTWRQRWLTAAQPFPDPRRDWMLPLNSGEVQWHLIESEPLKRK